MKTNDTIQKAVKRGISIGMATTLIIFGIVYILMVSDDVLSVARLEKALNTTGSYFGGIATLTAAYIASKMFNDWRAQHNKSVDKEIVFGVISNLNIFLLETQNFHNGISQVVTSSKLIQFNLSNDQYTGAIDHLRQIIRQHENAVAHVANNFSDLESVMLEDRYEVFASHFQIVIDSLMEVHECFIGDLNSMLLQHKASPDFIEFYFIKFKEILDTVNIDENGVIMRLKAIKKELAKFYRA